MHGDWGGYVVHQRNMYTGAKKGYTALTTVCLELLTVVCGTKGRAEQMDIDNQRHVTQAVHVNSAQQLTKKRRVRGLVVSTVQVT